MDWKIHQLFQSPHNYFTRLKMGGPIMSKIIFVPGAQSTNFKGVHIFQPDFENCKFGGPIISKIILVPEAQSIFQPDFKCKFWGSNYFKNISSRGEQLDIRTGGSTNFRVVHIFQPDSEI